jgi:hypothetical protein
MKTLDQIATLIEQNGASKTRSFSATRLARLHEALEWERAHPPSELDEAGYDVDAVLASIEATVARMRSSLP